ncbi:AraC family transcriptional regulator [Mycobacterium genavense]|uniref:AraC family transcriptional regulator n=1 Tax=Mycobacterium genavense TaxID=36812 RepID=UPI0004720BB0|nr:AraC family transcriptional regulator [Mycobacterium genavense]
MGEKSEPKTVAELKATDAFKQVAKFFPCLQTLGPVDRRKPLSLTQRADSVGPITVLDLAFNVDACLRCAHDRPFYQVNILASGQMELVQRGSSITYAPGLATICLPKGELVVPRWQAGCRVIALRVNRNALEDTLGEALGRPLTAQIEFKPSMVTTKGPARSWMHMFTVFAQELFRKDSALTQPLVATPFVDSLLHALLLAADHPYRNALAERTKLVAPHTIRPAVDIIESEPHLPLTVTSLAAECHVSSRALQQSFIRHLGMSPMTYLRQVRLRRAHQELLESDPSVETVASIAKRWGYSNPGRFAAAHASRYGETPAATLRRSGRATPLSQSSPPAQTARV